MAKLRISRRQRPKAIKELMERESLRQAAADMPPEPRIVWLTMDDTEEAEFFFRNACRWETIDVDGVEVQRRVIAAPACFQEYWDNPARFKDAHGGRGSGKSVTVARLLMIRVIWHGAKLLAAREIMDSIKESSKGELESAVYALLGNDAERFARIQEKEISCARGGRVAFIGLAKTGDKIKGYSDFDFVWVEEAATVTKSSWQRLIPTVRKVRADGTESEIWLTWNPSSTIDDTWKRFVSDCIYPEFREDGTPYLISREINFDQNVFFQFTPLRDDEAFMREADYDEWLHVYGGKPMGALENAIIKPLWIAAAMDLHQLFDVDYEDGAHLLGGFDPGGTNSGSSDPSAFVGTQNNVVCYLDEWKSPDPVAAADHVYDTARRLHMSEVRYDVIGVGLGAKGEVRKRNEEADVSGEGPILFLPFDASGAVVRPTALWAPKRTNGDHFMNAKAQAWGNLGRRFFHAFLLRRYYDECPSDRPDEKLEYAAEKLGDERMQQLISIDTMRIAPKVLEKLKGELAAPVWLKEEGKMQVETKDQLKKRGIASTNLADAVVMAFAPMTKGVMGYV